MLAEDAFSKFARFDADFRREHCRLNPLLFALTYLRPTLRAGMPGDVISFSEFHVAAYASAVRWTRPAEPYALRDAWLASRNAGKSSTFALILLIWALVYGHRNFVIMLSDVASQAEIHLETLRRELATNARLQRDFPRFCVSLRSTRTEYTSVTGASVVVRGLDSGMLGLKVGNTRPDLILIDDGEGTKSRYSLAKKATRLDTLLTAVLPLNLAAVVQMVGTTTRYGSILHDILTGKDWARSERFRLRHYPALITDPETGKRRSSWPHRWPLEFLLKEQGKYGFDLNFQCRPSKPGGTFWTPEDITVDPGLAHYVTRMVLAIDPAVTSKTTSDQTGIALVGFCGDQSARHYGRAVVLRAGGYRVTPAGLRDKVRSILAAEPGVREVLVERNQGHDFVTHALAPLPAGVRLVPKDTSVGKAERFGIALTRYQRDPPQVVHAGHFAPLVEQMLTVTGADEPDDIIDVVVLALEHLYR